MSEQPEGSAVRPTGKRSARTSQSATGASAAVATVSTGTKEASKKSAQKAPNVFKRLQKYIREVLAELRKVIWPGKKQMVTYTTVVLVFVAFMVAFIYGLDALFIQGVQGMFGN